MAAESSVADLVLVDDLYLIALCNGRNEADAAGLLALPDEEYAAELQLQEVIMSSAIAAAALALLPDSCAPPAATSYEATSSTVAAGECSSSPSLIPPPLAPATDDDDHAAAASLVECFPSSAGPAIPATFLFCKICMDAVPPSDAHSASRGCGHAFCATCLAGYILVKIHDRIADVKCPEDGCGSVLDPELCRGMLPGKAFEAWCTVMCESMLVGANKVYCPFKDCSAMMVVDDVGGGDVAESECPSCKRLFCARCGVPWHAGLSCAEYEQLAVGDRGKEDLAVMEMAKGEKWKRCPQCMFLVQKSEGCVHITCRWDTYYFSLFPARMVLSLILITNSLLVQVWLRVLLWMWEAVGGLSFLVQRSVRSAMSSEAALQ
jgi:E3 ubiquitin-protein ligase RNF144